MQISAISSAYSSLYAPIHLIGAGQNLPAAGNSSPADPANIASAAGAVTPTRQVVSSAVSPSQANGAPQQSTAQYGGSNATDLNYGEDTPRQSGRASAVAAAARALAAEQLAEGAISPSKAYAAASQVAGEYGGASADGSLTGQAAAAAAGLASSGTPVTLPELAAAVRSYMAMHSAANPHATSGVLLVA